MDDENALDRQIRSINERFEDIERQNERGKNTMIILIGSYATTYGLPVWAAPEKLTTCISQRCEGHPLFNRERSDLSQAIRLEQINLLRKSLAERGLIKEGSKYSRAAEVRLSMGKKDQLEMEEVPELVIGRVVRAQNYAVRFPLIRGNLNLSATVDYTEERAIADLYTLIEHIVFQRMSVTLAEVKEYDLILSLPDQFDKQSYEKLIEMLLRRLQPKGISLQQESVLCFLGRNCALGALVDIGYTQASLMCVEEGLQQKESCFQLNLNIKLVRDAWRAILLNRRGVDIDQYDFGCLEDKLWERCAHFSMNALHIEQPVEEKGIVPPSFRVALENCESGKWTEILFHTEDFILALNFLFETTAFNPLPLNKAILEWLGTQVSEGNRNKVLGNLIPNGGLASIPGFAYAIEERLRQSVKNEEGLYTEIAVVQENRDILANDPAFLGATVVPKLECFQEILILADQFFNLDKEEERENPGAARKRYLREKLTFYW